MKSNGMWSYTAQRPKPKGFQKPDDPLSASFEELVDEIESIQEHGDYPDAFEQHSHENKDKE